MEFTPYRCLYVIRHITTNLIKIGVASNWYNRAKALKIGYVTQPVVVVLTDKNAEAEKELHKIYDAYRLPGSEYFNLNSELLTNLISTALNYGTLLFSPHKQQIKKFDVIKILSKQDYIEVSKYFKYELHRQLRLQYVQRMACVLEHLHFYVSKKDCTYFKDVINSNAKKLKAQNNQPWWSDRAYKYQIVEQYIDRFFTLFRVYTSSYVTAGDFNLESLVFTTVKFNKIYSYKHLPRSMRVILKFLWADQTIFSRLYDVQTNLKRRPEQYFKHYMESVGPLYCTVSDPLPVPDFGVKV